MVEREARPGHPDRMAEGDRTAVDVGDLVGDAELGHRGDADCGECFVELEQIDVANRLADLVQRNLDGARRLMEQ